MSTSPRTVAHLARELNATENIISDALRKRGDSNWRWHGSLASPHTVPIIWNDIEITAPDGTTRTIAAVDYIKEA